MFPANAFFTKRAGVEMCRHLIRFVVHARILFLFSYGIPFRPYAWLDVLPVSVVPGLGSPLPPSRSWTFIPPLRSWLNLSWAQNRVLLTITESR